ncbi:ubiquitin carboxyl-terminal hydrolase-like isoform X1 [Liolophura sinensis]
MPQSWEFVDIYGLDPDLLGMVPQPVKAVVLLYPINEKSESQPIGSVKPNEKIYHIKQTIGNACGTIAMVHTLANNADQIQFEDGKPFQKFLEATLELSPAERATYLEGDKGMGSAHEDIAQEGQTQAPSRDEKVSTHFVALIDKDGELYELDGRKDGPVLHGKTTPDTLLQDAVAVVKQFMARDPDELNFTLMALVRKG